MVSPKETLPPPLSSYPPQLPRARTDSSSRHQFKHPHPARCNIELACFPKTSCCHLSLESDWQFVPPINFSFYPLSSSVWWFHWTFTYNTNLGGNYCLSKPVAYISMSWLLLKISVEKWAATQIGDAFICDSCSAGTSSSPLQDSESPIPFSPNPAPSKTFKGKASKTPGPHSWLLQLPSLKSHLFKS